MSEQHGNRHRRFEPPRDMKPGAHHGRALHELVRRYGGLNDVVTGAVHGHD